MVKNQEKETDLGDYKLISLNIALWGFILYFGALIYHKLLPQEAVSGIMFVNFMLGSCLVMAGLTSYMKYQWHSENKILASLRFIYMPLVFFTTGIALIQAFIEKI